MMNLSKAISIFSSAVKRAIKHIRNFIYCQYPFKRKRKDSKQTQLGDCNRPGVVIFNYNMEEKIRVDSLEAFKQGIETCGFLLGNIKDNQIIITDTTGPGTKSFQSSVKCEPDYSVLAPYLIKGKQVCGEWHLHLGYGASLSSGDEYTLLNASKIIPGFIAMVVNMKSPDSLDMAAFSVREGKIVKIDLENEERYARSNKLIDPREVADKSLSVLGLGSGGSHCVEILGRIGAQNFILVDLPAETLEVVNLPRHIGFERDLGKPKTHVTANILKMINRKVNVRIEHLDIAKDQEKLNEVISASDLVLACPGDPSANALINRVCLEQNKPVVFAGVFEKGTGGYVFKLDSSNKEAACFSCLFGITGLPDSNDITRQAARNYGIAEAQLHAQQGLCLDTGQISLIQARLALSMLLKDTGQNIVNIDGNLILIDNRNLQIRSILVKKRQDCYVCNKEAWLASAPIPDKQNHTEPEMKRSVKTAL